MAVSEECLAKIDSKTCEIAQHVQDRARASLYGGEQCCDTLAQDLRWYLASYLLKNYGNPDAMNPKKAYLSEKTSACMCQWVDRQFALPVG